MILEEMKLLLRHVMDLTITLFEFVGVLAILIVDAGGVWDHIKHNPQIRLNLATDMALGLEFKLDSETLHTVVVRELAEIAIMVTIIVLRAALILLTRWEIRVERADEEMQHHHEILEKV